ncbi:signal peptidase I [Oscillospiraceae bacterium OttesenSCG-928-F05]|nr:signal peptidase I [Oscillospiraceae bacterium OttesenSCG-928-F05]
MDNTPLEENTPGQEKKAFNFSKELYEWAQALVFALIFVVLVNVFVVRIIGVDGFSMEPTLHNLDKIAISNVFYTPEPGDVVVFTKESFREEPLVKRVIATSGQTVDINFETHEVWVDGMLRDEPFINAPTEDFGDVTFPATVPEGHIFVMGDNRNRSTDSRWSVVGMIDERLILGKVLFRLFPLQDIGVVE